MAIPKCELQFRQIDPKIFSAPGSADIIEDYIWKDAPPTWEGRPIEADASTVYDGRPKAATTGTYYRERENNGSSLMGSKLTEMLYKEFRGMPLRVYVAEPDIDHSHYAIKVRYGAHPPYEVGISLPINRYEAACDGFGFPSLIKYIAEELIWHIRKNIRDIMFEKGKGDIVSNLFKGPKTTPSKKEEPFRKILI